MDNPRFVESRLSSFGVSRLHGQFAGSALGFAEPRPGAQRFDILEVDAGSFYLLGLLIIWFVAGPLLAVETRPGMRAVAEWMVPRLTAAAQGVFFLSGILLAFGPPLRFSFLADF